MRIAVDIMGGDKAPREIVAGCVDASRRLDELPGVDQIIMVGREEAMREELARCKATLGDSLAFVLGDDEGFRWIGKYDITADEMLSGSERKKDTKLKEAKEMICRMLAGGKQVLSEDIDREGVNRGISTRTIRDAKKELGNTLKSKITTGRKKLFWME